MFVPNSLYGSFSLLARVSFVVCVDGNEQEIPADINKEVSHQVRNSECHSLGLMTFSQAL